MTNTRMRKCISQYNSTNWRINCVVSAALHSLLSTCWALWKAFKYFTHSTLIESHRRIHGRVWLDEIVKKQDWFQEALWSRLMETENIKAPQVIQKTTTPRDPGIIQHQAYPMSPAISSPRFYQLRSTSAQDAIVDNLRAVQRSCAMRLLVSLVVWCLCSGWLCWLG